MHQETQYLDLLDKAIQRGNPRMDRTGTGTRSLFGERMVFNVSQSFPLLTTKKLHWNSIAYELLWFLRGDTNAKWLQERKVKIWNEWAGEDGELGPIYGKQWRSWAAPNGESIDQITRLIDGLRNNPYSRRHIVSAWNPADIEDMALPPCHCLFQFFVDEAPTGGMRLSCQLYQRSADIFLGVPFNIASYSLLLKMVAAVVGMKPGKFVHSFGDLHIYENHIDQAKEQLQRAALPFPTLDVAQRDSVFDYGIGDFTLRDYNSWPAIKAKVAV